jgi:hypothetical protein
MKREEAIALYESGQEATVDFLVAQSERIARLEEQLDELLSGLRGKGRHFCPQCFDKQLKIDRLQTENYSSRTG